MLKAEADYPYPGSYAVLNGVKVRIVNALPDGRRFVQGRGVSKTVPLAHLAAYSEPRPSIDLWIDARVDGVGTGQFTQAGEAYADYVAWYGRALPADGMLSRVAFARTLTDRGFSRVQKHVRQPYRANTILTKGWAFRVCGATAWMV